MNRDDLIRWATQCKMPYDYVTGEIVQLEKLEAFAVLVAAAAKAEENEACAKVCEERIAYWQRDDNRRDEGEACAAAIRARKDNT